MSTLKTPGWTVEPKEYPLRYSDGEPCDTLHIKDEHGTVAWVPAGFPEKARLISALPELLAALQNIAGRLDRWAKSDIQRGPAGKDADWPTLLTQVHDALGKAEGKAQG